MTKNTGHEVIWNLYERYCLEEFSILMEWSPTVRLPHRRPFNVWVYSEAIHNVEIHENVQTFPSLWWVQAVTHHCEAFTSKSPSEEFFNPSSLWIMLKQIRFFFIIHISWFHQCFELLRLQSDLIEIFMGENLLTLLLKLESYWMDQKQYSGWRSLRPFLLKRKIVRMSER